MTSAKSRWAMALAFALLSGLFAVGCGSGEKKSDDPEKVEEKMKEYRDISQKERSG